MSRLAMSVHPACVSSCVCVCGGGSTDFPLRSTVVVCFQTCTFTELTSTFPCPQTWMDVDKMSGSTLEAMAQAVEDSAVVLVCVSKKYKESQVGTLAVHTLALLFV